jgi:DNA-binding transcriptional LysR family regulator
VAVRIGCCPVPLQRLQSFLGALHVQAPQVRADVLHLSTAAQLAHLSAGDLDVGIVEYCAAPAGVELEPLYASEPAAGVLPGNHRLAAKPVLRPGDLAEEPLLCPPRVANPKLRDALMEAFAAAGHRALRVREARGGDPRDLLLAVAQGRGIALMPSSVLTQFGDFAGLVTGRTLEPRVPVPETLLAFRAGTDGALGEAVAAARAVAHDLYRFGTQS